MRRIKHMQDTGLKNTSRALAGDMDLQQIVADAKRFASRHSAPLSGLGSAEMDLTRIVADAKRFAARHSAVGGLGALPTNIISIANANIVKVAGPVLEVMANVLFLKGDARYKLTKQPLNFLLDFFNPLIGWMKTCIDRVTKHTGRTQRKCHPLSSKKMAMATVQSQDASYKLKNGETFAFYYVIRIITQFFAICVTAPHILLDEMTRMVFNQPVGSGDWGDLGTLGATQPPPVDIKALMAAANASATAMYGSPTGLASAGLGDGGVVSIPAASAGTATAVAAVATPGIIEAVLAFIGSKRSARE